ncbi:hypothetical protein CLOP_g7971, partial [Closterium sp. NIES-67]
LVGGGRVVLDATQVPSQRARAPSLRRAGGVNVPANSTGRRLLSPNLQTACPDNAWTTPGQHLDNTWTTPGQHLDNTWTTPGQHLDNAWTTPGQHLDNTWTTPGQHLDNAWTTPGQHLDNTWTTPRQPLEAWSAAAVSPFCPIFKTKVVGTVVVGSGNGGGSAMGGWQWQCRVEGPCMSLRGDP